MKVSIAIPVYNEQEVIRDLLGRVITVLDSIPGGPHEVVFVDDGGTDKTAQLIRDAAQEDNRIVLIELSRNFGHQVAVTAALDHITGDVVVIMDGDLQDAPEEISHFIEKYHEGYDVVYARRKSRKENLILRSCYFVFYRIVARLSTIKLPVDSGDFSLISGRVVNDLREMGEHHRYVRGLRAWVGYSQIGIDVERSERQGGNSKYSLAKLLGLAFDGMFSFSTSPLRAATFLGVAAIGVASLFALYAIVAKFIMGDSSPKGFTALIVSFVFLSGIHFLILGIIGEYVGRIYEETKNRPLYLVKNIMRNADNGATSKPR